MNHRQISLLIFSGYERINEPLFPLKGGIKFINLFKFASYQKRNLAMIPYLTPVLLILSRYLSIEMEIFYVKPSFHLQQYNI